MSYKTCLLQLRGEINTLQCLAEEKSDIYFKLLINPTDELVGRNKELTTLIDGCSKRIASCEKEILKSGAYNLCKKIK